MKFKIVYLVLVVLFLIGCQLGKTTGPVDCTTLTTDLSTAITNYTDAAAEGTATKPLCDAYVEAMKEYVCGGCDLDNDYPQTTINAQTDVCTASFSE